MNNAPGLIYAECYPVLVVQIGFNVHGRGLTAL
jgi:hypothetical protein